MNFINKEDLMFGHKGFFASTAAKLLMSMFGINKANGVYNAIASVEGDYPAAILDRLDIKYNYNPVELNNIPAKGPLIIVSNHPTGGAEGVFLLDLVSKVRPDVKIMANYLLWSIEPLRKYTVAVNPFDNRSRTTNMAGLKEAIKFVAEGGALIVFPSGSVATWQHGFGELKDMPWEMPSVKFIRRTGAPVMPVWVDAHNSLKFHLMGKIHPMLRTVMLPNEMYRQAKRKIGVAIGTPLPAHKLEELGDMDNYARYLRATVEYMKGSRTFDAAPEVTAPAAAPDNIIPCLPVNELRTEIDNLPKECRLFGSSQFAIYCAMPSQIPVVMNEIGRLREVTFRAIGEGTMKAIDTDRYDSYYHQLFVWDSDNGKIVGAYRLGFGAEIVRQYGVEGFYTHSLFRQSDKMSDLLSQTIELGRSFVAEEYQRRPVSLFLLWKGIVHVLLVNPDYRYLLGPVTIPGKLKPASKRLVITYLLQHHLDRQLSAMINPVNGLEGIDECIDASLIKGVEQIDLINKLVMDIEGQQHSIPILIRRYLQLNSKVLGFNVDHDFSDGLDALMLLDLKEMPERMIAMLSKEIEDIDVIGRFKW